MPPAARVDVLVFGGGPAGAAAALALARAGRSVAVVTRTRGDRPRIGETVPPTVVGPLAALGVWDAFLADGHTAATGTVACWGDERPHENDSILNPYGHGWHLDRARFDAMLLAGARAAGARVAELPPGGRVEHDDSGWGASVPGGSLRAPFLVDATGRAGTVAARVGVPRQRADRLIGLVRFGRAAGTEPRTLIEACAEGWWYAAVLPDDRAVTAFFTDADLLPVGRAERERCWAQSLSRTRLVRTVMRTAGASRSHAAPAHTSALAACAGRDWVAVGDAARTLDPLSGQGLVTALGSAMDAAQAVLDGHRSAALGAFAARTTAQHRAHLSAGRAHYRREGRWPHSPFWSRRHRADHPPNS